MNVNTTETIFEHNVNFLHGKREFDAQIKVWENSEKFISGQIRLLGLDKEAGFDFCWKKGEFGEPYVSNLVGGSDWRRAKKVAKDALDKLAEDVVSDNAGATVGLGGDIDPDYVSKLINAGHVRRPCKVQTKYGVVIRRGTVVNIEKLSDEDRIKSLRIVALWNDIALRFKEECGTPESFREWFDSHVAK